MKTRALKTRVLFVCMGNICRSPTAEGVFRRRAREAGLDALVEADSAGTHDYHIGEPPDARSQQAAARRGYDLGGLRARQVAVEDFAAFDYVLAMDRTNHAALLRLCPQQYRDRVRLFLDFAPACGVREVPDPYYGGARGFEAVLDLVEAAAQGLCDEISKANKN